MGRELALNVMEVDDPDGHTFRVINEEPSDAGAVASLCLRVTSLEKAAGGRRGSLGVGGSQGDLKGTAA